MLFAFVSFNVSACVVTLSYYGAIGNGIVDDTGAVISAFNSSCNNSDELKIIDGENKVYSVYGTLRMLDRLNATLKNAKFIQKKQNDNAIRTIFKTGGTLNLYNVIVDRGLSETIGSVNDSAGIWLEVDNSEFNGVEVTGNGIGQGLFVINSHNVYMSNIYVHHMRWTTPTRPQYEQVTGIRIERSTNVTLANSRVESIFGNMGNGVYTRFQSDGVTIAETKGTKIFNTVVEKTGEGIDITGSAGNTDFEIAHSTVFDAHSYSFKFANTASNGVIRDSSSYRAGYAGFVISGLVGEKASPSVLETRNILVDHCKAFNTGHNTEWKGKTISGFLIMKGNRDNTYPTNINIKNSLASNDSEHLHVMLYGFYSETDGNTVYNTDSYGHVIDGSARFLLGSP